MGLKFMFLLSFIMSSHAALAIALTKKTLFRIERVSEAHKNHEKGDTNYVE